ncbi:MAG: hypothetical protein P8N52_09880 [Crocinitomicaceae bacterium]|nr:hypothetical protein [Crocinitomicaceae bacterium]MDG1777618.1 hypothetical protein [Crocinitomicaceae bacterium]
MRKFILNKDKKERNPSAKQIRRQKDFSRLHHDYEKIVKRGKHPLYKDPKLFVLLLIIGLVLLLVLLESN